MFSSQTCLSVSAGEDEGGFMMKDIVCVCVRTKTNCDFNYDETLNPVS